MMVNELLLYRFGFYEVARTLLVQRVHDKCDNNVRATF